MNFTVMKAIYAIAYIEASTSLSAFQKSSFHPVMICNPIAYCYGIALGEDILFFQFPAEKKIILRPGEGTGEEKRCALYE